MAKKSEQMTVRVTPEEKREIERSAAAVDMSASRYMAESALSEGEPRPGPDEIEELRKLWRELRSIGGNVNQIAKALNKGRGDELDDSALRRAAEAVEQAADVVMSKISG
jgi:uncharacterized protein (DUF1778 family)